MEKNVRENEMFTFFHSGICVNGKRYVPLAYIASVEEPEFGCEGRPEQEKIYGTIQLYTLEKECLVHRSFQMEEMELFQSGLDDAMWLYEQEKNMMGYAPKYEKKVRLNENIRQQILHEIAK